MDGITTPPLPTESAAAPRTGAAIVDTMSWETELAREKAHASLSAQGARGLQLMLWAAASSEQFVVCRADRTVIWRQRFSDLTPPVSVESDAAAIEAAARQAIWLAGRARHEWGAQAATLRLVLARHCSHRLENLQRQAFIAAVALEVDIDVHDNPAHAQLVEPSPIHWCHIDLGTLIDHRRPT